MKNWMRYCLIQLVCLGMGLGIVALLTHLIPAYTKLPGEPPKLTIHCDLEDNCLSCHPLGDAHVPQR